MRWGIFLVAVLLSGCGSKGGDGGFETPERQDGVYVIHLTDQRSFDPAKARVPVDAIVSFHFGLDGCDVRSEQSGGPDSRTGQFANGIYPEGGSFNWAAPASPQDFDIYCSRHEDQGMRAVLRVA